MKLIIDIDDKRIKGINLLAKEQDIATPYPTLEQIIANGIPLDKIREEIKGLIKYYPYPVVSPYQTNYFAMLMEDEVLQIIDKYRGDANEVS